MPATSANAPAPPSDDLLFYLLILRTESSVSDSPAADPVIGFDRAKMQVAPGVFATEAVAEALGSFAPIPGRECRPSSWTEFSKGQTEA